MPVEHEKTSKKPYVSPELVIYGDVREITQIVVGGTGKNDHSEPAADKTGL